MAGKEGRVFLVNEHQWLDEYIVQYVLKGDDFRYGSTDMAGSSNLSR